MCATFLLKRIAVMKYEQKSIFENHYPYFDVMCGVLRAFCVQRKTRRYARAYSETYPYARTAEVLRSKNGYEYGEDIEIAYRSQVTNDLKHAYVTLPANYDESKKYPVLYLLHGMACTHKSWLEMCNAKYVVQNLTIEKT